MAKTQKHIVLGVTGSIAAYKAAEIIRQLKQKNFRVSVIMTEAAKKFITPLTLAALSRRQVQCEMFQEHDVSWEINHISLAKEADALLIAPATANVIGKIACGIADDLLTCTAMATTAPVFIAPAMNERMYRNKIVQENIAKLRKHGVHFIGPSKGKLACGTEGEGRLIAIEDIVRKVKAEIL